ncbi:multicopper oxidase domain-containing protein [Streptomyces anulatus]|uniref:multicopper oxidase domain-containing protein n=1 Tax=Streptomyces anulatus TaxID=1892 RepID=UPI00386CF1B0
MAVGSTVRIALRFDGPCDPDTPYMYHCHLLSHEDEGKMGPVRGGGQGAAGGCAARSCGALTCGV